ILGALINGFLYRGKKGDTPLQPPETKNKSSDNILSESMAQATLSMLAVGGYICVFNVLIDAAVNLNIISAMTTLVPFAPDAATEALLCGIIEMTRGCALLKYAGLTKPMTYSLAGAIISFGGLSVLFQTITFLGKCKIKTGTVLLQKLTQSIITFILCFALFSIFKI
ncbi:MAG: hypothetical protein GX891_05025, partial [Clostridiales bacterium]|nr:hypothetical protein [Clostridiales bacterium]